MMVTDITDQNFEQLVLKTKQPVLVDMWAPWCVPCRMVAPIVEKLSLKYDGKCQFYKMNIDENQKTAAKYRVMSIPTLLFFKDGKVVNTVTGAVPERSLISKVEEIL
ncbi:MAG: thioredoxin [Dehalococcoidales bacterium]|nr:thioredoxin [Dehalococcoidales bacterium]